MFYLTLKKNYNYRCSYIIVLVNGKRRVLKKIGTFGFNKYLGCFVLLLNMFQLLGYFNKGIIFNKNFYKYILQYINQIVL